MSARINEIATIAANLEKKPSKARAFERVLECIGNEAAIWNPRALADLYAYFMPTPGAKPKTAAAWVDKAVGRNNVRKYLNFAYSDGERLIATDGHRLHLAPLTLPPGYYDKALTRVFDNTWCKYPDVNRVIPGSDTPKFEAPERPRALRYPGDLASLAVEIIPGCWVDQKYWQQAIAGREGLIESLAWAGGLYGGVRIDYADDCRAVIMPVRMPEGEGGA